MKLSFSIIILFLLPLYITKAQTVNSKIRITEVYSPNGNFYIKSIPYDNEEPSLKGKSFVYNKQGKLLYTLNRGFNNIRNAGNFLSIGDDGKTIVYVIIINANESIDGLKSVSIYKKTKLVKSFTLQQIINCDPQNVRCNLDYRNYDKVVDMQKSNDYIPGSKKVFRDNVSNEEKFLSDYTIFTTSNSLYITDPQKIVHIIDLNTYAITANINFNDIYPNLKNIAKKGVRDFQLIDTPYPKDNSFFPNLKNGDTTGYELGKYIGMKAVRFNNREYLKYRYYQIHIQAYISKNGKIDIINIDADKPLPVDRIRTFFNSHLYNVDFLPPELDKWYFHDFFWLFRNISDEEAIREKSEYDKQQQLERERRLTLDSINHVYIPKNLEDCFVQLDKQLPKVAKTEMLSLKGKDDMILYHLSLGMWMRNNWGLHGGSRLLVYFKNRGFSDPEDISGTILEDYYDWLNNKKEVWKEFETKHPVKN